jgi:hypothetical protein
VESHLEPTFPQTIGRCIYCGTDADPLSDEHIIPSALNGEWVLNAASCQRCADVTSHIELRLLRGEFLPIRAKLALRTRRPKQRPSSYSFKYERAGQVWVVDLPIEKHPGAIALPVFGIPGHLDKECPDRTSLDTIRIALLRPGKEEFRGVSELLGAEHFTTKWPDEELFARFIGKIAYGFAVGCVGLNAIETAYILPAVMGVDAGIGTWVGCPVKYYNIDAEGFHAITLERVGNELRAYVRLFAQFGAPEYVAIIGTLGSRV